LRWNCWKSNNGRANLITYPISLNTTIQHAD
jgi:hypothetical protein